MSLLTQYSKPTVHKSLVNLLFKGIYALLLRINCMNIKKNKNSISFPLGKKRDLVARVLKKKHFFFKRGNASNKIKVF